jgi:hypothetical protein
MHIIPFLNLSSGLSGLEHFIIEIETCTRRLVTWALVASSWPAGQYRL